ncbi:metal-sensing transcriptional repressor [Salinisphaera sp.]|uniref:metal-sensing transcriptional repressor n=1 Tax=Salinisphaera sp. TaxID=1914330 RepID=UPI002D76F9B0|nr:metal-sensing transcriptional repressor [Salinisphaera sp.]HET7313532.1 metal-sensing transcriptional repressor [Salinisphaera sp.]
MNEHESHPRIINRLKRAHGHLARVIAMLEAEQGCLEIAQQLSAVEKAITNAKRTLVHDHIDHCFDVDLFRKDRAQARALMEEFKSITRYL